MQRVTVIVVLAFVVGGLASVGIAGTRGGAEKWPASSSAIVVSKVFTAKPGSTSVGGQVNCPSGYNAMGAGWDSSNLGWVMIKFSPHLRTTRWQYGLGTTLFNMGDGVHGSATGWSFSARRAETYPDTPITAHRLLNRIAVGVTCLKER